MRKKLIGIDHEGAGGGASCGQEAPAPPLLQQHGITAALPLRPAAMARLRTWMADHGREALALTLRQAADIAGLEPHYLSALFRDCVGESFRDWRRRVRTMQALQFIQGGSQSIDEAAVAVGYGGRRSLERAVKIMTGKSPGEFKKNGRSEPDFAVRFRLTQMPDVRGKDCR